MNTSKTIPYSYKAQERSLEMGTVNLLLFCIVYNYKIGKEVSCSIKGQISK